jgi:hypothetical protein
MLFLICFKNCLSKVHFTKLNFNLRDVQMLSGTTPNTECAVLLEEEGYFFFFGFVLFL